MGFVLGVRPVEEHPARLADQVVRDRLCLGTRMPWRIPDSALVKVDLLLYWTPTAEDC